MCITLIHLAYPYTNTYFVSIFYILLYKNLPQVSSYYQFFLFKVKIGTLVWVKECVVVIYCEIRAVVLIFFQNSYLNSRTVECAVWTVCPHAESTIADNILCHLFWILSLNFFITSPYAFIMALWKQYQHLNFVKEKHQSQEKNVAF